MEYKCGSLVGKTIEIIYMEGEPQYTGRIGTVEREDDAGGIHGTWGGLAIYLDKDEIRIL